MKLKTILFALIVLVVLRQSAVSAQEAIGINFFDMANSGLSSPTCWDNNKSWVYLGGAATFTRCNTNYVPVNTNSGSRALDFTTTFPSGWCNVQFKLDWGHSVNFLRYGQTPLLYLRVKWGAIASGADTRIYLTDNTSINNRYNQYNGIGTIYSDQSAYVTLSTYAPTPSTTAWQDVYIPLSDFTSGGIGSNPNLDITRISILQISASGSYTATNTLYMEKIKIVPSIASQYSDMIKVNQIGYLPTGKKLAIVSYESGAVPSAPTYFQVRDAATGTIVSPNYSLTTKTGTDDKSGDIVKHADFSAFTTPGRYVLCCPEIGQTSLPFDIRSNVFNEAFRDSLRFFYYARSGYPIAEPYAEGHSRPTIYANNSACARDYGDHSTRDVQGGWFDAGDVHQDVHNSVAPMWMLLQTFEQFKNKLGPNLLNLPESDNSTNDLVLLIKYQLDWFKKMQNADGSVHFIVYSPTDTSSYQLVSDVSTGSACILAGIFAKAYTQFSTVPGMESYAADLLARAELSWTWLMAHPTNYNPVSPSYGEWSYRINDDTSFRSFAAIELYIATNNSTYRTFFETAFNNGGGNPVYAFPGILNNGFGASGASNYYQYIAHLGGICGIIEGYLDYATTTRSVNSTIKTAIKAAFTTSASAMKSRANGGSKTYRLPMLMSNDLYWGSSGILCGNAYILLKVYEWTGDTTYRDTALDALEWVCGRNTVSRVFITGDYSDYPHGTDIYSFYWFDHTNPVPGYLCGNVNMLNDYWLSPYIKYSWKYYMNIQNASLLEPCLPGQSQLCYLLGYFASNLTLIPGDINPDGTVDEIDLMMLAQAWLSTSSDANWNARCELATPANNIIDFADFAVFAGNWYKTGW